MVNYLFIYSNLISFNTLKHKWREILLCSSWQDINILQINDNAFFIYSYNVRDNISKNYYIDDSGFCIIHGDIYEKELFNNNHMNDFNINTNNIIEKIHNNLSVFNDEQVKKFNGSFIIFRYYKKNDTLLLFNDKWGLRPCYYTYKNNLFCCSSLPNIISNFTRNYSELNKIGLAQLITIKYTFNGNTLRKGIYQLQPGHKICIRDNNLKLERYINYDDIIQSQNPENDWIELLSSKMQEVGIDLTNDIDLLGLPLSGGKDTRALAIILPKESYYKTKAFTWGNVKEDELKIAKKIVKIMNIPHFIIDYNNSNYFNDFIESIRFTDGMFNSNWIFRNFLLGKISEEISTILDGMSVWGPCFRSGQNKKYINNIEMIRKITGQNNYYLIKAIIINNELRSLLDEVQHTIEYLWRQFSDDKLLSLFNRLENPYIHFKGLQVKHYFKHTISPLMDDRIACTFLQAPRDLQFYGKLLTESLKKINRELAAIPHNKTKIPLSAPTFLNRIFIDNISSKWYPRLNKIFNQLHTSPIFDLGQYSSVSPSINFRSSQSKIFFIKLLENYEKNGSGLFDTKKINELFLSHYLYKANYAPILSSIATYLLWESNENNYDYS